MPKLQVITVGGSYFPTWQIPLHTSKQSIKIASTFRTMEKIFNGSGREAGSSPMWDFVDPSDRTVSSTSTSSYSSTSHVGRYRFPTKDVFAPGKYGQKEWDGPPRWMLQGKLTTAGMRTRKVKVKYQRDVHSKGGIPFSCREIKKRSRFVQPDTARKFSLVRLLRIYEVNA